MTDQKQAPERDSVKWWIDNHAPVDVTEAFEDLTKQRDELSAEYGRLSASWQVQNDKLMKAEEERDAALARLGEK